MSFYRQFVLVILCATCLSHTLIAQDKLALRTTIQLAKANNIELKVEELDSRLATLDIEKAKVRPNPIFNAQLLMLTNHRFYPQDPLVISPYNRQDWFQLTKKTQIAGQRKSKINLSVQSNELRKIEYKTSQQELSFQVASSWIEVWYAQVNIQLAQEAVNSLNQLLAKKQFSETSLENLRYKILDDQYDLLEIEAKQLHQTSMAELNYLINSGMYTSVDFEDKFFAEFIFSNLDSLMNLAFVNRLDLQRETVNKKSALANSAFQKSLAVPSPEVGLLANPQNTIPYFGVFLTQPIPLFDRNQADQQKAKVAVEIANVSESNLARKIRYEVKVAYDNYTTIRHNKERATRMLSDADQLLDKIRNQYIVKHNAEVDVWEAENAWFDAEKMYFRNEYELRKSYLRLLYVTGLINSL